MCVYQLKVKLDRQLFSHSDLLHVRTSFRVSRKHPLPELIFPSSLYFYCLPLLKATLLAVLWRQYPWFYPPYHLTLITSIWSLTKLSLSINERTAISISLSSLSLCFPCEAWALTSSKKSAVYYLASWRLKGR